MDGLERSVRLGLVALAVSDMMFCALYFLSRLLTVKGKYSPYDSLFGLYFHVYREVCIYVYSVIWTGQWPNQPLPWIDRVVIPSQSKNPRKDDTLSPTVDVRNIMKVSPTLIVPWSCPRSLCNSCTWLRRSLPMAVRVKFRVEFEIKSNST